MYDYIPNDDEGIKKHMNRLEYLSRLEPGWYDGVGEAPSQLAVDAVKTFIDSCSSCIENLAIFPREEGGLLLDIRQGGFDLSIEVFNDASSNIYGIRTHENNPENMEGVRIKSLISDDLEDTTHANIESLIDDFKRIMG
jgi:hypothetical protein